MTYLPIYLPSNRLLRLPDILLSYVKIQLSSYSILSLYNILRGIAMRKKNTIFSKIRVVECKGSYSLNQL